MTSEAELMTVDGQREVYRKRAKRYDLSSRVFNLLGFPVDGYRAAAVDALALEPGDTVLEMGVGTGANLELLVDAVGPDGRVVGVDLSPEMLAQARERVDAEGWANVDLVQADLTTYSFPRGLDGVISTFAIMLVPAYDDVIARATAALAPGGRIAILDFKEPGWPDWAIKAYLPLVRLFGGALAMTDRHPWEAIEDALGDVDREELYMGGVFLAVGEKA